ncbi:MAG: hypothetical protein GY856_10205 [bacterium]|nr:hypothetical protein [bacterium]
MIRKGIVIAVLLCAGAPCLIAQSFGVKKRPPKPSEYGNVVVKNFSEGAGMAPVVFKHWLHRSKYTCRLCHVELGFAMAAGATEIRDADNRAALYCGTCHNGETAFGREEDALMGRKQNCDRCHSREGGVEHDFYEFVNDFPRGRLGNRVDWEKAEDQGLITLQDHIEGVTLERQKMKIQPDMAIEPAAFGMPGIIFSHEKHAVWNGCELCHPEIFQAKKDQTGYEIKDIFDGKFCGACHASVAFPNQNCQGCHVAGTY